MLTEQLSFGKLLGDQCRFSVIVSSSMLIVAKRTEMSWRSEAFAFVPEF
ncbi:hypothetical protein [Paenibacillus sp. IHBB 10380]|nr:hypothetical protein [Paenibacillus sp. IHBB 10380]